MATLLIVDECTLLREGLRQLIRGQPGYVVVADAGSADAMRDAAVRFRPQIALVGNLPELAAEACATELLQLLPTIDIVMLKKQQTSSELFAALGAFNGHGALVAKLDGQRSGNGDGGGGPWNVLSMRERDVFQLLVRGNSNRSIARLLGISPKTVETHRAHVLRKLGMHSIVDLVRLAARHQLPLD